MRIMAPKETISISSGRIIRKQDVADLPDEEMRIS